MLKRLGVYDELVDDAAQDVFIVVHRRFGDLESLERAQSWVYGIAIRVASDYRRRQIRNTSRRTELPAELKDERSDPERTMELRQSLRLLDQMLGELDEEKRTAFVLVELEQLTVPEVADMLGINLNTAYSRLRAARVQLEKFLRRRNARKPKGGEG